MNDIMTKEQMCKTAAWDYYVQLRTRIATQKWTQGCKVGEALESLYALFQFTRERATGDLEAKNIHMLWIDFLNRSIRPFMVKWHSIVEEEKKYGNDEFYSKSFVKELEEVQQACRDECDWLNVFIFHGSVREDSPQKDGMVILGIDVPMEYLSDEWKLRRERKVFGPHSEKS